MMTELTETELKFNVNTISAADAAEMLEAEGWKQEEMHFGEKKISAQDMAMVLNQLGWEEN